MSTIKYWSRGPTQVWKKKRLSNNRKIIVPALLLYRLKAMAPFLNLPLLKIGDDKIDDPFWNI